MKRLAKTRRLTVRYTGEQLRDITQAARLRGQEIGELVDESSLVRELSVRGAREIIEQQRRAA